MNPPVSSYTVDLLYDELPLFTREEILAKLRDRCGAASLMDGGAEGGFNYFFPDLRVPFKGSTMPVQVTMEVTSSPLSPEALQPALKQTWDWGTEAKSAIARHQSHLTMSDLLAAGLPYKTRLGFFQNVLGGVLELLAPLAIRWRPAEKMVGPIDLLGALKPGEKRDPIRGAVNVRRTLVKTKGGIVMDTLGLAALGLPDFECDLGERMPNPIEVMLRSLARYEYDLGDVIADGRTVKGGAESFKCVHGISSVDATREVIVLRPVA